MDHESICEFHRLCTGSTEFAGDNDFTSLSTRLHDETEDTIASTANHVELKEANFRERDNAPADGKATEELVAEGRALSNGGETAVLDLLGVELERVLGELEALLDEGSKLADAAALLTEDLLGVGGTDDNL